MGEKFGRGRHRPEGDWVQTTGLLDVAGVQHRKADAIAYARAVQAAERNGWTYGVRLEPDPTNRHDSNAIRVIGHALTKRLFGSPTERAWHIGYVPREVASELVDDLISQAHPYAAELYGIYVGEDFVDIEFFVLVPKGSPGSNRTARRIAQTAIGPTPALTDEQRQFLKQAQLGLYRNTRLSQAEALKRLGHFDGALDMYLRVAWLDQQGTSNVGLIDGIPLGGKTGLDRSEVMVAPGIIGAIGQGANTLGIDLSALKDRFAICGDREAEALLPRMPVVTHEAAWAEVESALEAVINRGSRWRSPK